MTAPETSAVASLRIVAPSDAVSAPPAWAVPVTAGGTIRAAPLLAVDAAGSQPLIVVGQAQITVSRGGLAAVVVVVQALWQGDDRNPGTCGWRPVMESDQLERLVTDRVAAVAGEQWPPKPGHEGLATTLAYRFAHQARDEVAELRSLRYQLERGLGETLRGSGGADLERVLADIIQLSTACGRIGDEARAAAREGLWTWRTDEAAYHAHRRLLDPTVPVQPGSRRGHRRPWFRTLDHGVRHCLHLERLVGDEARILHSLLTAASTIAVTRDAKAQETFTVVATVGGLLLGLPALILALYGATSVVPLTWRTAAVFIPLGVAAMLAAAVAARLPGRRGTTAGRRFVSVLAAAVVVLILLAVAGWLAPEDDSVAPSAPVPTDSVSPAPAVSGTSVGGQEGLAVPRRGPVRW